MMKDGLWNVYNDFGMGVCGEIQYRIIRQEQFRYIQNRRLQNKQTYQFRKKRYKRRCLPLLEINAASLSSLLRRYGAEKREDVYYTRGGQNIANFDFIRYSFRFDTKNLDIPNLTNQSKF
ncbi:hypothetical protein YC2023_024838 [Brassica napus]